MSITASTTTMKRNTNETGLISRCGRRPCGTTSIRTLRNAIEEERHEAIHPNVMRSAEDPDLMNPALDFGDHIHPNPFGYFLMGQAVELKLFEKNIVVK